ncbi:MAG TPA: NDP-sugar synthase [Sulfolobales archaeon]|nr:NDP-sugar synthase [Sulfolobales archaeon]
MHVIILAGGFATRLRPLTLTKPKALLPVLDRPLVDWILEEAVRSGVKRVTLALHHMHDRILGHVLSRWGDDVLIDHYVEHIPLGDAGPLREIGEKLGIDYPVVVVYGDIFSSISIKNIYSYHKAKGGIATIAITKTNDVRRFGAVDIDSDNRVRGFIEKPPIETPGYINAGVYVFSEEAIRHIEVGKKQGIGRDLMPKLLEKGDVYAYIHNGVWNDIGMPEDYIKANLDALNMVSGDGIYISPKAFIEGNVETNPPLYIGDGVSIEDGASIGYGAIIMKGARIGRGSLIIGSLVMERAIVEQSAIIINSIVGEGSYIGRWARISKKCIVGDGVYLGDTACLGEGTIVLPYKDLGTVDLCNEKGKVIL